MGNGRGASVACRRLARQGRARRSSRFVAQLASGGESRQQRRSGSLSMDRLAPSERVRAAILVWRQGSGFHYAATRICLTRISQPRVP